MGAATPMPAQVESAMMRTIPTYVVTHPLAALEGLSSYARAPQKFGLATEGRRWRR